jgi:hypothetical protein
MKRTAQRPIRHSAGILLVLGTLGAAARGQAGQFDFALMVGAPTFDADGKVIADPAGPKNDAESVARVLEELNAGDTRAMRSRTIVTASYNATVVQFPIVK